MNMWYHDYLSAPAPITVPAPGASATLPFTLDALDPALNCTVYLGTDLGGGTFAAPPISGSLQVTATRRATVGEQHIVDLSVVSSAITAASITVPGLGATGVNTLSYDQLTGTCDLNTGFVAMSGRATITNSLFPASRPVAVWTNQSGTVNLATGMLGISTGSVDLIPYFTNTIGTGCPNPPLTLDAYTMPRIGRTFSLRVTDIPAGTPWGLMVLGFSDIPGGFDLSVIGMTGCSLWISIDDSYTSYFLVGGPAGGAQADYHIPIPSLSSIVGLTFYVQAATASPNTTPFGFVSSNGGRADIGP